MRVITLTAIALMLHLSAASRDFLVNPAKGPSLEEVLEMAAPGDCIELAPGRYPGKTYRIDKSLSIFGKNYPVFSGDKTREIFTITADHVLIAGIHFRHSGQSATEDLAAVKAIGKMDITVMNCRIDSCYFGVYLQNCSSSLVCGNFITGNAKDEFSFANGIHMWKCDSIRVQSNWVSRQRDGIYLEFVTHSLLAYNYSHDNVRYGLHFMFSNNDEYQHNTFSGNGAGVAVMFSNHVGMSYNTFSRNWGPSSYGILLKEISDSRLLKNVFTENTMGIYLEGTSRIHASHNRFASNGWGMRIQASCNDNLLDSNEFTGNSFDVATNGSRSLNRFVNNYWDHYEGYDLDRNGVGDVPFRPVGVYSSIVEEMPVAMMMYRSFTAGIIDRAERVFPSAGAETLADSFPVMKRYFND